MKLSITDNFLTGQKFIDLRNVYEPKEMKEYGFDYFSVGR